MGLGLKHTRELILSEREVGDGVKKVHFLHYFQDRAIWSHFTEKI